MSIDNLLRRIKEAQRTPGFQFERLVVDLTEEICQAMQDQGISRSELAKRLGKSKAWITKLLRGDQNMTLKTVVTVLWELGQTLNVDVQPYLELSESVSDVMTVSDRDVPLSSAFYGHVHVGEEKPKEARYVLAA